MVNLQTELGRIDIYLLDQIMRGNIPAGARIFDAGCGEGRNLIYLLRAGHEVFAIDESPDAVASVRELASSLAPGLPDTNFRVERVEATTMAPESVDVVISNTVLHFARDEEHFWAMLGAMWDVLADGGLFFSRLASTIGMEDRFRHVRGRRFVAPDGAERFLVDETFLVNATEKLGAELVDPLKTTVVQNQRCMTTWVMRKRLPSS